ncbi:hypothetical protein GOV13_01915 [Candidatus Pacearchaeota archaeon]|nr:hypothetical protein [Candidatus Pacearchaeota archaeon]
MESPKPISFKEQRVRNMTHLYYSRPEVQKAMFEFSKNREISSQYFDGFGKRPDSFEYLGDVMAMVQKGTTSFHCSEELWENPLDIVTGMSEEQANELRIGWDLLIDIDCKWFDYSKLAAKSIIEVLEDHNVKNFGIKFSGSKGWHIIVPWKSFPKEVGGTNTKDLFPALPREVVGYIRFEAEKNLRKKLPEDFYQQFKDVKIKKGIRCLECNEISESYTRVDLSCQSCKISEIRRLNESDHKKYPCPTCKRELEERGRNVITECLKCNSTSDASDTRKRKGNFAEVIEEDLFELMGLDILLVSPRHLFRMPYSLHEKTALSSTVIYENEIDNFQPADADPMKVEVRNFMPDVEEGEASELLIQALDWHKDEELRVGKSTEKATGKFADYKPIKLENLSEENFPPCTRNILKGISDGKKRAVFALLNLFRSVGMEKEELEKRIYDWNKKNPVPLKEGYIKSQLIWSYRRKPIMPPNCKEFYQGFAVCTPNDFCKIIKNPVNYVVRKNFVENRKKKEEEKKVKRAENDKKKKDNKKTKKESVAKNCNPEHNKF